MLGEVDAGDPFLSLDLGDLRLVEPSFAGEVSLPPTPFHPKLSNFVVTNTHSVVNEREFT